MSEAERAEDDVGAVEREVLVDARCRSVDVRFEVDEDVAEVRVGGESREEFCHVDACWDAIHTHL